MLLRWRRTFVPMQAKRSTAQPRPRIQPGVRYSAPYLEALEDRCLLAAGALDLGFGTSGTTSTPFIGSFDNEARAAAIQTDGKIVAVGTVTNSGTGADFALVRYNPDASLDSTFGTSGRVSTDFAAGADNAFGVAIQTDGKLVVAGSAGSDFALARYNADGTLDATFGSGGRVLTDFGTIGDKAAAVALQSDGRIVVVGSNNDQDFAVARYDTAGNLDNSFGAGGRVLTDIATSNDFATSLVIQPDGNLVVAGTTLFTGAQRFAVVRYTPTGLLDSTFGAGSGIVTTIVPPTPSSAAAVGLGFGSSIVVAGTVGSFGSRDFALVKYDSSGNLDTGFGVSGIVTTNLGFGDDVASGLVVQPDGSIVVSGSSGISGQRDFVIVRYTSGGALDTAFNATGILRADLASHDDEANAVALQSDGKLVLVGSASSNSLDFALVRADSTGNLDGTFDGDGKATTDFKGPSNAQIAGVVVQPDGKIVAAGTVGGEFALARYNADGSLDATFGNGGRVLTSLGQPATAEGVVLQVDGKIVVAGTCDFDGTSRFALARHNSDGSRDATFGMGGFVTTNFSVADATAADVALQADGKIVVVGAVFFGTQDFAVARYNTDGSLDTTFAGGGQVTTDFAGDDDTADAVFIQADGRIVAVGVSMNISMGDTDVALARYNSDGSLDASFGTGGRVTTNLGARDDAADAVQQADGRIVVVGSTGNFSNLDFAILRYNANGTLDGTFGSGGSVTTDFAGLQDAATAVVLQTDGKIVVAGSSGPAGPSGDFVLARYQTNGSLDGSFGTAGRVTTDFFALADTATAIAFQANGRFIVGGSATSGSTLSFALARYLSLAIVVDIAASTAQALEAGRVPGVFTLTRSGDTLTPVTVRYTVGGTAQAGSDYAPLSGNLVFAAGATTATIQVTPLDGAPGTCSETILVSLSADPAYALGAATTGTVTLIRDPLKIFVIALYQEVLERLPDAPGQSFWVSQLSAGASRGQVASAFWVSPERRGMLVDQFYATFLRRPADAAGRDGWISFLLAGGRESDVVVGFLTSPEYSAGHATNAVFVQGLYTDVLQRQGGDAEVAFWEGVLETGIGERRSLSLFFLGSEEAFHAAIEEYYAEFLGRAPDPIGRQVFLTQILAEQTNPSLLIAEFLGSEEYFARVQLLACP